MRVLKYWSLIMLLSSVALYFAGFFSGAFWYGNGFIPYGPSSTAKILLVLIIVCLLLGVTSLIVYYAIKSNKE